MMIKDPARWSRLCVFILLASYSAAGGAGLAGLERLEHLPPDNPLADQWVRVVYQDRQGFLWLGTINGVHRFDGDTVESFRHDPGDPRSLPNNFINSIFEDSRSVLWIATLGGLATATPAQAQAAGSTSGGAGDAAALSTKDLEALIKTLEDKGKRDEFLKTLKGRHRAWATG